MVSVRRQYLFDPAMQDADDVTITIQSTYDPPVECRDGGMMHSHRAIIWWAHPDVFVLADIRELIQPLLDGEKTLTEIHDQLALLGHKMHHSGAVEELGVTPHVTMK